MRIDCVLRILLHAQRRNGFIIDLGKLCHCANQLSYVLHCILSARKGLFMQSTSYVFFFLFVKAKCRSHSIAVCRGPSGQKWNSPLLPPPPLLRVARAESKEKEGRKRGRAFLTSLPPTASSPMGEKWIGGGGKRLLNGWLEGARENVSARLCRWCEKKIETGMQDLDTLDTKQKAHA